MFERFTEKARRAIFFARYEAGNFGSLSIEPEHLLLGLMQENRALLQRLANVSLDEIRKEIEAIAPQTANLVPASGDLPVSRPLQRALAFGAEDAERIGHPHIGTEHLLLGLLREPESIVPGLLLKYGITREGVLRDLAAQSPGQGSSADAGRGR